jgi:hypothetical protein
MSCLVRCFKNGINKHVAWYTLEQVPTAAALLNFISHAETGDPADMWLTLLRQHTWAAEGCLVGCGAAGQSAFWLH